MCPFRNWQTSCCRPPRHSKTVPYEISGKQVLALETEGVTMKWNRDKDRQALYQTVDIQELGRVRVRMIPYFAWDNCSNGEMMV